MKVTPMFRQYLDAKAEHPDSILFFRMGDFYEVFFDDAATVSRELELTLTARGKESGEPIPMAGVPHHAAAGYIRQLVAKGYHVAICEQLKDPSTVKGIVPRGVVRVITPGTLMDDEALDAKRNNFTVALAVSGLRDADTLALASVDISTGEVRVTELQSDDALRTELRRLQPSEVLVAEGQESVLGDAARSAEAHVTVRPDSALSLRTALSRATSQPLSIDERGQQAMYHDKRALGAMTAGLSEAGLRDLKGAKAALALLYDYVAATQGGIPAHLDAPEPYHTESYLVLDAASAANLEVFETLMGGRRKGSLFSVIDRTVTSAGGRRLRTWLSYPLTGVEPILARQRAVTALADGLKTRSALREALKGTADIQRATSKLAAGQGNARDLGSLRDTLSKVPGLLEQVGKLEDPTLRRLVRETDPCEDVVAHIDASIVQDPPTALTDGGLIAPGYSDELDRLMEIVTDGKAWMLRYEAEQRQRTGIGSLKVKHNKVFGYFIEVTRANLEYVPDDYIRKQTLSTGERYFTPELKEYEEQVLTAGDRRCALEYELFEAIRQATIAELGRLRDTASKLAELDALAALAELSQQQGYVAPTVRPERGIVIEAGRHPVVETMVEGERFVPNDTRLDDDRTLIILTGPNMSGKSTVIRQVALIALLAQIGSHVPARRAEIGVVDQIFSRVGASDNLARGQSTFMVEMSETAHILRHATERSLVILDEIGRGTSTYDGLSIAWAVAEYLHDSLGALTLFATHYHELTDLSRVKDAVHNMNIAAKEYNDDIVFLRTLVDGPANRSYGIQVARLAGVPESVVVRAREVLRNLESTEFDEDERPTLARDYEDGKPVRRPAPQLSLFGAPVKAEAPVKHPVVAEILKLPLDTIAPIEALNLLYRLQKQAKRKR